MQVSHLRHSDEGVQCTNCKACFPLHRSVLRNPERLLEAKEKIAGRHTCGRGRNTQSDVRALRVEDFDAYWATAVRNAAVTLGVAS